MNDKAGSNPGGAAEPRTVLIVDDTPQNLTVLGELLQSEYRVRAANSGERALRAVGTLPCPDLILLDIMMPGMDGYEVLKRLRADAATRNIPVIFITAMTAEADEERGLELGAVDYITKPFSPAIVLARVRAQLELKQARDRLARQNEWLEAEVQRRMRENLLVQDMSMKALAVLAETRDLETGHHITRTQIYVELLGRHLAAHPRFAAALAGKSLELIVKAAPLHDIGKVGIPDAVLLKPGRLDADELVVMKTHAAIGAAAIDKAMREVLTGADDATVDQAPGAFNFMRVAHEIALTHHEKWDGSGYPAGLAGDAIPVSGRLMALADVFDALSCRRVYKPPMPFDKVRAIIIEGRGQHFDPDVVDAYLALREQFEATATRLADSVAPSAPATL
ncbi:MAG: two-component system response regulator [Rhodocyclaceae bacterium]|jgi:putative two-component system response regulator|nr:two-component system response regulator [Rhodocyclaceae bacterium]